MSEPNILERLHREWEGQIASLPGARPAALRPGPELRAHTPQAVFAELEDARLRWTEITGDLRTARYLDRVATSRWTLRELLSHMASWAAEFRRELEMAARGDDFDYVIPGVLTPVGPTEWNEKLLDERRGRVLGAIIEEFDAETQAMQDLILGLPDEALAQPSIFPLSPTGELADRFRGSILQIASMKSMHDCYHLSRIARWLDEQSQQEGKTMTTATQVPSVVVKRAFAAPIEQVFRACTEPAQMAQWFARDTGYPPTRFLEADVRPGGNYRVEVEMDKLYRGWGRFVEVEPSWRLAFTWTWAHDDFADTLVKMDFRPGSQPGTTDVTLTHQGLPTDRARHEHEEGWKGCLAMLEQSLGAANAPSAPPYGIEMRRTIAAPPEKAFDAWTRPERMKKWLCRGHDTAEVAVREADVRAGGRLALAIDYQGHHYELRGTYREVQRPEKLVFTWRWEGEPEFGETVVSVEFRPLGSGAMTEMVLSHQGFRNLEGQHSHELGWKACFDMLEKTRAFE